METNADIKLITHREASKSGCVEYISISDRGEPCAKVKKSTASKLLSLYFQVARFLHEHFPLTNQ